MTNTRKLEILWDLYFIAVGLDTLMTREGVIDNTLPWGICELMDNMPQHLFTGLWGLADLHIKQPKSYSRFTGFWWLPHDWNIRSKALLKAIKKVSNQLKQNI